MHERSMALAVVLVAVSVLAAGCSRSKSGNSSGRRNLPAADGNSQELVLRLSFPKDYHPPDRPTWMDDVTWTKYGEGYLKGWHRVASRWKCHLFADGGYEESGHFIDCRQDNGPYGKGWEDGQMAALVKASDLLYSSPAWYAGEHGQADTSR